MAWTVPPTAVAGALLTASQWNAGVRDNLLETAPAKATLSGRIFVSTGANSIAQRSIVSDKITAQQNTASGSYVNLGTVGATVTVTTGTLAQVHHGCQLFSSTTGTVWASYAISGATTVSASDEWANEANGTDGNRSGVSELHTVTAGSNTFQQKYRVGSGTGTFDDRYIIVWAL